MADSKASLVRDGTMQVTAKEGIQYLQSEGKGKLLERQGLVAPEKDEPSLKRDGTMAATAKEADRLLGKDRPDDDAKTRGQQHKLEDIKDEQPPAKKPRMAKGVTMVGTAKEAERILGDDKPDADAMTRGQQKKIDEISKDVPASPTKKAKGGQAKAKAKGRPSAPKRTSTISKAIEEAKYIVPVINVEEGRRTRSASKPKPAMKRAGTMQQTAAAGKDFLKRSKKSKKAAPVEEEDDEEDEEEETA